MGRGWRAHWNRHEKRPTRHTGIAANRAAAFGTSYPISRPSSSLHASRNAFLVVQTCIV